MLNSRVNPVSVFPSSSWRSISDLPFQPVDIAEQRIEWDLEYIPIKDMISSSNLMKTKKCSLGFEIGVDIAAESRKSH